MPQKELQVMKKLWTLPLENLYGHDWLQWSVRRWQRSKSCQWWHQPDFTFYLETIISKRMTLPKRNEIFFKRKWWISESCHYFTIKLKVPFYFWGHFWHIGTISNALHQNFTRVSVFWKVVAVEAQLCYQWQI